MHLLDDNYWQQLEVVVKVVIAGFFGGLIGLERELANRPAGLRTHAILAIAAALFVSTADLLVEQFADQTRDGRDARPAAHRGNADAQAPSRAIRVD